MIKKIGRNYGISVYKKALMSEHRKNCIFRNINYFVNVSVITLPNLVFALAQKLVRISKRNFICSLNGLRLRADWILVDVDPK